MLNNQLTTTIYTTYTTTNKSISYIDCFSIT